MIVKTAADLQKAVDFITNSDMLAYDIETTGLNPRQDAVVGFGVSNSSQGFYFPVTSKTDHVLILQMLATKQLLAFNASFDMPFTKNYFGVDLLPSLHTDVLLLKHTCDEEFPFGLKEIATKLFGLDATKEKAEMQASVKANGGKATEYYKADTDILGKYCIQDCLLTFKIYNYYLPKLKSEKLEQFFYQDEVMPLYKRVTIPMECHGMRMDVPKLEQTWAAIKKDIQQLETEILTEIAPLITELEAQFLDKEYPVKTEKGNFTKLFKPYKDVLEHFTAQDIKAIQKAQHQKDSPDEPIFNLQSKHHLKKLFFDVLKETPLSSTATGQPQVDEEFLSWAATKHPWVSKLIDFNKLGKLSGTYMERFLEDVDVANEGIFYPRFQQHRTVSGRYAGDMQQLPRTMESDTIVAKYTNLIREFIIPRNGKVLMSADYESLEPHIFAHVSGDARLQVIFNEGKDFYSEIAIRTEKLVGVSSDKAADNYLGKVNKAARQKAKSYSLGIPYGMTGYKLKYEIGCSEEEANKLVNDYLQSFPDLAKWMYNSQDQVKYHGFIRTQAGRVRHMPRAKELFNKYGESLADSLALWKRFHEHPAVYQRAKEDRKEYKNLLNNAINFQIQGLAASIVNRAALNIVARLKTEKLDAAILAQVHDELVFEVSQKDAEAVGKLVQEEMQNVVKLSVPLKTVPQFGTNYRQCK